MGEREGIELKPSKLVVSVLKLCSSCFNVLSYLLIKILPPPPSVVKIDCGTKCFGDTFPLQFLAVR